MPLGLLTIEFSLTKKKKKTLLYFPRYFVAFLGSMSIVTLYMTSICIYYLIKSWKDSDHQISFARSLRSTPVGLLLAIVGFVGSWYPAILFSAHFYFMCTGQSTHEVVCAVFDNIILAWKYTNIWTDINLNNSYAITDQQNILSAPEMPFEIYLKSCFGLIFQSK